MFKFLYNLIPLNILRSYLISKHFALCDSCSSELADETKIGEILLSPKTALRGIDLWPGTKAGILYLRREGRLRARGFTVGRKWQLGVSAAVLLLIIILVPSFFKHSNGIDREASGIVNREIEVKSIRIENRPAKSYYFHSNDTNKIILWVQKTKP